MGKNVFCKMSGRQLMVLACVSCLMAAHGASMNPEQKKDSVPSGMPLLASATAEVDFKPARDMNPTDLEIAVNKKNPYTLYRKGSVAEYAFQYKGKQFKLYGGPTYMQQIVADERIENGLLVAYVKQAFLNKKGEPSKGISASFKDYLFPTEIDTAGTYHLTHNLAQDILFITKRSGYGVLIPGNLKPGMKLATSTIYDESKGGFGNKLKVETVYDNWEVVGKEKIETPAGSFDCMKLTGHITFKQPIRTDGKQITCWIARGIGIVQYEEISDNDKKHEPIIYYLNKLELK